MRTIKAVVVTSMSPFEARARLAAEELCARGFETTVLLPDFLHIEKQKKTASPPPGAEYVHMPVYRKNLSLMRIAALCVFSRGALTRMRALHPDLVYAIVPANTLARASARYQKDNPASRLIFDINDLWPESLPVPDRTKKWPPLTLWRALRAKNIGRACGVVAECDLFANILKKETDRAIYVARMASEDPLLPMAPKLDPDTLRLGYLGSVNNIIDIDTIARLIRELSKFRRVELVVVGEGERLGALEAAARGAGAEVLIRGAVYDLEEKQRIFDQCDFALNLMRDTVRVGLTMKSVDYFRMGVPLINAIPCDTRVWVAQCGVGVNLTSDLAGDARRISAIGATENFAMRERCRALFTRELTRDVFCGRLAEVFDAVLPKKKEDARG